LKLPRVVALPHFAWIMPLVPVAGVTLLLGVDRFTKAALPMIVLAMHIAENVEFRAGRSARGGNRPFKAFRPLQ
jgi:hypothetical protein